MSIANNNITITLSNSKEVKQYTLTKTIKYLTLSFLLTIIAIFTTAIFHAQGLRGTISQLNADNEVLTNQSNINKELAEDFALSKKQYIKYQHEIKEIAILRNRFRKKEVMILAKAENYEKNRETLIVEATKKKERLIAEKLARKVLAQNERKKAEARRKKKQEARIAAENIRKKVEARAKAEIIRKKRQKKRMALEKLAKKKKKTLAKKKKIKTKDTCLANNKIFKNYNKFKKNTNLRKSYKIFQDKKLLSKATKYNTKLKIDISEQRVRLYVDNKVAIDSPCTTGAKRKFEPNTKIYRDKRTPKGTFKITEKISDKRSTIFGKYYHKGKVIYKGDKRKYKGNKKGLQYKGASLKNWMRLTSSGIGLHASKYIKRHPGTNGCIRLPYKISQTIFKSVRKGTEVSIVN